MSSIEHHYQMLGLEPGASGTEIKQAYRDLVIVWHPDRFQENSRLQKMATEKLKEVNLAYEKLIEYIENSWCENLFGFEDEEFTAEREGPADAEPDSENMEGSEALGKGKESTETGNSAERGSPSRTETPDWFEVGGEFTKENSTFAESQPHFGKTETSDWFGKGYQALALGRLEEAVTCFDKELGINPRLEKAWTARGLILEKLGKLEESLKSFDRALEIDQKLEEAWISKGNILYSLFKNQEALECYDMALVINPKNTEVWYRRWVASERVERTFLLDSGRERSSDMPNDLIGDLSQIRLFDIIKSLVDRRKSGMVLIDGKEAAELYIEGGSIVHGKTDGLVGEEAIFAIMDLDEGRVTFDWQLSPEKQTVRASTEQLMSIWRQRDEEWSKVRKVMASSHTVFSIRAENSGEDRTISAKQWGVLALCDGRRSVSDIAALLGRSVFEVAKTIVRMVDTGLLEEAGSPGAPEALDEETVSETFFAGIETELKKVLGPIGRVIIDDTLASFEKTRDDFPKDRVMSFIRTVADQIVEEQKRAQFEKGCLVLFSHFENS